MIVNNHAIQNAIIIRLVKRLGDPTSPFDKPDYDRILYSLIVHNHDMTDLDSCLVFWHIKKSILISAVLGVL